jgi:hypothetical protein
MVSISAYCCCTYVYENNVLRRIFGLKWDEVKGSWRKLHNEELHNLYSSPNVIRMIKSRTEMCRVRSTHGEKRNAYTAFVGKPDGKRLLGRPICKWEDNIKMDLREIVWAGMNSICQAQDRGQWRALVNTAMNLRVP